MQCVIICSLLQAAYLHFLLLTLIYVFANIREPEEGCWVVKAESGDTVLITLLWCSVWLQEAGWNP